MKKIVLFLAFTLFLGITSLVAQTREVKNPAEEKLVTLAKKIILTVSLKDKLDFNLLFSKAPKKLKSEWKVSMEKLSKGDKIKEREISKRVWKSAIEALKKKLGKKMTHMFILGEKVEKDSKLKSDASMIRARQKVKKEYALLLKALVRTEIGRMYSITKDVFAKYIPKKLAKKYAPPILKYFKRIVEYVKSKPDAIKDSQEAIAIATLKGFHSSALQFKLLKKNGYNYPTPQELRQHKMYDLPSKKYGYTFHFKYVDEESHSSGFEVTAIPIVKKKGWRSFYVSKSGLIRATKDGTIPNGNSPVAE